MNVNWSLIAEGMHYVQKKTNKGKLELTSQLWIVFTFQQGLHRLDSMLAINFYVTL